MIRYFFAALLLAPLAALAQSTPAYDPSATHRRVQATQLWPQAQAEFVLDNGDYLLLSLRGQRILDDNLTARSLGFDYRQALLGYEHFWDAHWSVGGALRLVGVGSNAPIAVVPEVLLRHRAPLLGGFTFGQRLSVEHAYTSGATAPLEGPLAAETWLRLRADLERLLYVGHDHTTGLALRPRLSYEAATHLRLQKADGDPDERTIQYTALRAEAGVRVTPTIDFTSWFAYQTRYLIGLPQYDQKGNQTAGGKGNNVYPTFGLDLRFTILPAGFRGERRQLPTQH